MPRSSAAFLVAMTLSERLENRVALDSSRPAHLAADAALGLLQHCGQLHFGRELFHANQVCRASTTAYSIAFCNSRTLPGQRIIEHFWKASGAISARVYPVAARTVSQHSDQRRNVLLSLAERRHFDLKRIEPVIQIGRKRFSASASRSVDYSRR